MSFVAVAIEGIELLLLAKRGIYWPEQQTLFIADTHFGKEATFRRQGLPVPKGSTQGTLLTVSEMVREYGATRLILLGDMFHASSSLSKDIRDSLDQFFTEHSRLRFTLVLGNHDRHVRKLLHHWPLEIVASGSQLGQISISHLPQEPSPGCDLLLCGHIHPAFRFPSRFDSIGKLPCFWLSQRQLVLPAVGEFTGKHLVKPAGTDRTWVIADEKICELFPATGKPPTG